MEKVRFSTNVCDIIEVNRRSANAKRGISIIELSSLDALMDHATAEEIRQDIIERKVVVRQLTNLPEIYAHWTKFEKKLQEIMQIRYISKDLFDIQNEILIFDDVVAMYRVNPDVYYVEIHDKKYAEMMRGFFDNLWSASQIMVWGVDGGAKAKQYMPFTTLFEGIPVVVYPAKDDGDITQAFPESAPMTIESHIIRSLRCHKEKIRQASILILYVWNDGAIPMIDVWMVMRNDISDDSGFLYDCFILQGDNIEDRMGTASGNSLIVITAEELLLRRLVLEEGKSFIEATNREKYFPAFPAGMIPGERFSKK